MKRINLLTLALLFQVVAMMAVPADRKAVKVSQPDGTQVTIRLHGDEWMHFTTTDDGYSVVKNEQGYYVYAQLESGRLQPTAQVAHDADGRSAQEEAFVATLQKFQAPEMSAETAAMRQLVEQNESNKRAARRAASYDYNNFKGLVILVEFNDKPFSREDYKDILTDMLNQENYSGFDGRNYTGSVCDYFSDNSNGLFQPQFDVYGPYQIDYSQYDANGSANAYKLINAALNAADDDINFADYDRDGDNKVDMVFFMFAGNSASFGNNDERLFWPHRSVVTSNGWSASVWKDGVRLYDYASSTELYGWTDYPSSVMIDGIGTFCHEFSHVLGLPDFYDTDYEQNGQSNHPNEWSLMAGGVDFNYGRTPAGYSLYERWAVGFIGDDDISVIDAEGSYTLNPLYSSYKGYRINTPVNNEYFLFENRQKNSFKWDEYLPGSGMLVHRVDRTNMSVWNGNRVNNNPNHNYYEVIRAGGPHLQQGEYIGSAADVFPGTNRVTELHNTTSPANLKTWSGKSTQWGLTNIRMSGGVVTFDITNTYVLKSISLPETVEVGAGVTLQLTATAEPDFAEYTLTWASSDESVATVDGNGLVTGIAPGTATVTVTANNGMTASCLVTVIELTPYDIAGFKQQPEGTDVLLKLEEAVVTFAKQDSKVDVAFVRDASGSLMLSDTDFGLKTGDVLNGSVLMKRSALNGVPQAEATEGTMRTNLTVTAGSKPQPRELSLDELTDADYSEYVIVKAASLVSDGGVWAVSGDARARLWNGFLGVTITNPTNYENKFYDIPSIYGIGVNKGQTFTALHLVDSPVEVQPSGISELRTDSTADRAALYNLHGQRVNRSVKGLLIQNGRKFLNR